MTPPGDGTIPEDHFLKRCADCGFHEDKCECDEKKCPKCGQDSEYCGCDPDGECPVCGHHMDCCECDYEECSKCGKHPDYCECEKSSECNTQNKDCNTKEDVNPSNESSKDFNSMKDIFPGIIQEKSTEDSCVKFEEGKVIPIFSQITYDRLVSIISDETGISKELLLPNKRIIIDSFEWLDIILDIEDTFDIEISAEEESKFIHSTVAEICNHIDRRVEEQKANKNNTPTVGQKPSGLREE